MKLAEAWKEEIVASLLPLEPEKVILFGSYAWGEPHEESDIDLFVVKEVPPEEVRTFRLESRRRLRGFQYRHRVGLDILADSMERVTARINQVHDQFYEEVFTRGEVLYAK